jgi:hypothetical protein
MELIYELKSDVIDTMFLTGGLRKGLHNIRECLSQS